MPNKFVYLELIPLSIIFLKSSTGILNGVVQTNDASICGMQLTFTAINILKDILNEGKVNTLKLPFAFIWSSFVIIKRDRFLHFLSHFQALSVSERDNQWISNIYYGHLPKSFLLTLL